MKIPADLCEQAFELAAPEDAQAWLVDVDKAVGGLRWVALGGIENNVHTVQVSADSALALVERPINSLDAVLDLKALELGQTARTPHEAARAWWGVPPGGLSDLPEEERRKLADLIRVTNLESGEAERPTIVIQDLGTGQHPDDFPRTLLSLLESNKKSKTHQMGVYNAGGAASYAYCSHAFVISRKAPQLLGSQPDEVGLAVVRYDPLDPDRFKSGRYEYCVAKDGSILRMDIDQLPDPHTGLSAPGYGTYVKLVSYELSRYHRGAYEPKRSLWHLFHAAIPDPCLPFRIVETRARRFSGVRGAAERRVVTGLLHLLRRPETSEYNDERELSLAAESGKVVLRYFVVKESDPEYFTTAEQGLTLTLNGQRHGTKDRAWIKRNTDLNYIYKRLIVLVDGNGLTNAAKREVFSSTRESHKDSAPLARRILERVVQELREDEDLRDLDEAARQKAMAEATRSTSERIKRQLASQIAAFLKGQGAGAQGGKPAARRPPGTGGRKPRSIDDSAMPEIPDKLEILTDPVVIEAGGRAGLRLGINAKNDFLPKYASALKIVLGPDIKSHIKVTATGRLLGGRMRVSLEAADTTPVGVSTLQVALVDPELPVFLTAYGAVHVVVPSQDEGKEAARHGGEPDVDVLWHGRADWEALGGWDEGTAGTCEVTRDEKDRAVVTKVVWHLNGAFAPYESVVLAKKVTEATRKAFEEAYQYPLCWAMFQQSVAAYERGRKADEDGGELLIPEDYVKGELARVARAVLIAKEPELAVVQGADTA